jgi:hypothetical protein
MNVYYQFTTTGLGSALKGRLFPFKSSVQDQSINGNSDFTTNKLKMPLVGAYYMSPLLLQTMDGERINIPEAAVTLIKSKEIKTTPLVSGNGTIKEFISDKDIDITIIVGIVATDEEGNIIDAYPEKGIKDLQKILDKKESILIFSSFLSLFEIDGGSLKVVITEYSLSQQTAYNRQVITIKATSDFDHILYAEED